MSAVYPLSCAHEFASRSRSSSTASSRSSSSGCSTAHLERCAAVRGVRVDDVSDLTERCGARRSTRCARPRRRPAAALDHDDPPSGRCRCCVRARSARSRHAARCNPPSRSRIASRGSSGSPTFRRRRSVSEQEQAILRVVKPRSRPAATAAPFSRSVSPLPHESSSSSARASLRRSCSSPPGCGGGASRPSRRTTRRPSCSTRNRVDFVLGSHHSGPVDRRAPEPNGRGGGRHRQGGQRARRHGRADGLPADATSQLT